MQTFTPTDSVEASDDTSFDDLDSLLTESVQIKADAKRIIDGRKRIKAGAYGLNAIELGTLEDDIARIELSREWLPKADVAMFSVQTCQCCSAVSAVFTGFFQRQSHRSLRHTDRWIAAPEHASDGLPKEIKNTDSTIVACPFCIGDFGYPVEQLGVDYSEEVME